LSQSAVMPAARSGSRSSTSRRSKSTMTIIDAHDSRAVFGAARLHPSFETAQYRVVARRHADSLAQALSWAPAHAIAEKINDFGCPIGAARPRTRDLGQLRGEGLTGAGSVLTLPALETELHCDGSALRRQILQMALVPSVSARRSLSAVWTDARPAGHPRNQPLTADPLRGQNSYALPEGPTRSSLHTVKLLLGPQPIKSATGSEAEPIKWIFSIMMASAKSLFLQELSSHYKMAPDRRLFPPRRSGDPISGSNKESCRAACLMRCDGRVSQPDFTN